MKELSEDVENDRWIFGSAFHFLSNSQSSSVACADTRNSKHAKAHSRRSYNSFMDLLQSPLLPNDEFIMTKTNQVRKGNIVEAKVPIYQTVQKNYAQVLHCRKYMLKNRLFEFYGNRSRYTANPVTEVK